MEAGGGCTAEFKDVINIPYHITSMFGCAAANENILKFIEVGQCR